VEEDFSQANNLAASNPEKLKELQDVFFTEATKNHVFPIDDRRSERFDPSIAGRPDLMGPRTSLALYEGMTGILENAFINIKNRNYTITSEVELKDGHTNGVIIPQAGRFGGWVLYMKGGKVHHEYNFFGLEKTNIASSKTLGPGKHEIKYEFIADKKEPGTGGKCTLYVDGQQVATGQIPKTQPFAFSADEGVDVGVDNETNVSNEYKERDNRFTGKIFKVVVDIAPQR
jgi:arylsulfatase